MMSKLAIVAVLLGIVLLVLSASWQSLFPPTRNWTEEKSLRLSELGSETNRLKFAIVQARENPSIHAGQNPAEIQAEYDQVRNEYDTLQTEFESARDSPQTVGTALRWAGIVLVGVGAVLVRVSHEA